MDSASAPRLPWDFHPALRPERLRLCARLLVSARRDALALAREELGDDNWSVGCRAFSFGCRAFSFGKHRLQRVAESREHPWLRVLDGSHHFVFLIEDVPVRFYRGAADDAPERTLKRQEVEAQQLGLALGVDAAEGLVFRLAVETGPDGAAERVVFLALRCVRVHPIRGAGLDRWRSGRSHRSRKPEYSQGYRGFESHPVRQLHREKLRIVADSVARQHS